MMYGLRTERQPALRLAALASVLIMLLSPIVFREATSDAADPPAGAANQKAVVAPVAKTAGESPVILVRVVGVDGKPVAGAELYWFRARVHDLRSMKPQLVATTDKTGQARFADPSPRAVNQDEPASWDYQERIVVKAAGHGFKFTWPGELRQPNTARGVLARALGGATEATITLPAAGDPIRGRLVDIEGRPVAGATIRTRWFDDENGGRAVPKKAAGTGAEQAAAWRERLQNLLNVIEPEPLRHVLPGTTTDADGRFELRDLGPKQFVQLLVEGERIETTEIVASNAMDDEIALPPDPRSGQNALTVYGRNVLRAVGPSKPVTGRVVDIDTGEPIADAVVRAFAVHGSRLHSSREREEFAVRTDADGQFRITGLPIGDGNSLVAFTTGEVPYIPVGHEVSTAGQDPSLRRDFRLKRGVWAEGRVFDAVTDKPFTGEIEYYYFRNRELENSVPGLREAFVDGRYWTNANGEYRIPVLPSRGILAYRYDGSPSDQEGMSRYPRGAGAEAITGIEDLGGLRSFPTLPHYLVPSNYARVAEVLPIAGEATIRVNMPLEASKPVLISVVDAEGKPVVGFEAYGAAENWGWQKKEKSEFDVADLRPDEQRKIFVFHRQRNLAGGAIVKQAGEPTIRIELKAAGSIRGRIVDRDGDPIADAMVFSNYGKLRSQPDAAIWANHPKLIANPTQIPVDKEGRFVVDGLIPGWKYSAHVSAPRKLQGEMTSVVIGQPFENVSIEPGEKKDLGDIVIRSKE